MKIYIAFIIGLINFLKESDLYLNIVMSGNMGTLSLYPDEAYVVTVNLVWSH